MNKGMTAILSTVFGAAAGALTVSKVKSKAIEMKTGKVDKFKAYYNMLNQWLLLKQDGKNLKEYFKNNGYNTIAIYGMGEMGNRLYDELKDSEIQVKYAIDKNADSTYAQIPVKDLEDDLEEVDVIVVTAIFAFEEIEEEILERVNYPYPIISLEDVVYEI